MARPTMLASASGELKTALAAERALQAVRHLEHAAFARHLVEQLVAADVGHVLAEHHHPRVVRHLVVQRPVDERHHRFRLALRLRPAC